MTLATRQLGVSNLAFWPLVTVTGMAAVGAILTAHLAFAALQYQAAGKAELQLT